MQTLSVSINGLFSKVLTFFTFLNLHECMRFSGYKSPQELDAKFFFKNININVLIRNRPLAQLLSARFRCGRSGVRFPGRSNRHSVANDSPPLRRFFGAVFAEALSRGDGHRNSLHASA